MMNEEIYILPLNNKLINNIIEIVRSNFKSDYLLTSIYRSKGINLFINYELENSFSPYEYKLLKNNSGKISCFAEFKKYSDFVFLNMIATPSNLQSKGAASQLLTNCINDYSVRGYKYLYLDVFASNKIALDWYLKLGFKKISKKWLLKVINYPDERQKTIEKSTVKIQVLNYPQTKVILGTYGFGMLEYVNDGSNKRIGIIDQDIILNNDTVISEIEHIFDIIKDLKKENVYIFSDSPHIPKTEVLDSIQRLKLDLNDFKNSY